ncbi:MAG: hypothetical protein KAG56_09275, partial [Sulfurovaceae bacterium]|nr:hypothetical protein [Sulfurovaceae bacterium]
DGVDGKDGVCPTSCGKDEHSKSCDCDCETYETSVPVLSSTGMGLMFFISTLFGMFLFRKETLLTK